jgi:hypothetical protein
VPLPPWLGGQPTAAPPLSPTAVAKKEGTTDTFEKMLVQYFLKMLKNVDSCE